MDTHNSPSWLRTRNSSLQLISLEQDRTLTRVGVQSVPRPMAAAALGRVAEQRW